MVDIMLYRARIENAMLRTNLKNLWRNLVIITALWDFSYGYGCRPFQFMGYRVAGHIPGVCMYFQITHISLTDTAVQCIKIKFLFYHTFLTVVPSNCNNYSFHATKWSNYFLKNKSERISSGKTSLTSLKIE